LTVERSSDGSPFMVNSRFKDSKIQKLKTQRTH